MKNITAQKIYSGEELTKQMIMSFVMHSGRWYHAGK